MSYQNAKMLRSSWVLPVYHWSNSGALLVNLGVWGKHRGLSALRLPILLLFMVIQDKTLVRFVLFCHDGFL